MVFPIKPTEQTGKPSFLAELKCKPHQQVTWLARVYARKHYVPAASLVDGTSRAYGRREVGSCCAAVHKLMVHTGEGRKGDSQP